MQTTNDAETQHVSPRDLENGTFDSNREQGSTREVPEQQILTFPPNDLENPLNWSTSKKTFILLLGAIAIFNSVLDSALPSGSIAGLKKAYDITSTTQQVLPISVFLFGYVLGPLCFGPLSETFGRRVVMVPTFAIFVLATGAQGLVPACMSDEGVRIRGDCEGRWTGFLFLRLLAGINAASSIAVVGGIYADVFKDHQARGWAVGVMILMTTVGPQLAPPIAGFLLPISWRWTYYMGVIIAFASFIPMLFLPETYGPIILKRRAKKLRQEPGNEHIFAKIELEKRGWKQLVGVVLMRPLRMFFTEPIVFVCCVYLSLVNGLLFLCFQGYPRVFQNIYGMNAGVAGLAYLPIALGAFIAFLLMLLYDNRLSHYKLQNQTLNSPTPQSQSQSQLQLQLQLQKPWLTNESYRRLPLACLGGPCYVLAIFWFGWTSTTSYHVIIPILSGIPFGMGYFLIFTSLLNYLTDAYKQYAASALSAAAISRSLVGALLPIAAGRMYDTLGIGWGESLLGFVALVMCGVPFLFIGFGERIRGGSRMFRELEGLG